MVDYLAEIGTQRGATFSSETAMRELGYRVQPMTTVVRDTYA